MLSRLLARGHLRTRWRRYALLALVFGLGLESFFVVVTVVDGAKSSLIEPLASTLTGSVRVTNESSDLAAGRTWTDHRTVKADLERLTGGTVVARLESSYLTIRGEEFDNWSAGLLVGIDPVQDRRVADHEKYIVWGQTFASDFVFGPDGRAWIPVVLGEPAAERLNLSLPSSGEPDFSRPLLFTSGHTRIAGSVPVPVTVDVVVVGVFRTGLEPLDRFTAFIPIAHARYLAGYAENDPVANAFLVHAAGGETLAKRIQRDLGLEAKTDEENALAYMGSMLVVLYAAATLGLVLFLVVIVIWLVHETGAFLRADAPVLATLRAIGVPEASVERGYVLLTVVAVALGAAGALVLAFGVLPWLPAVQWSLSGLSAKILLRPHYLGLAGLAGMAVAVAALSSWLAARRVRRLGILAGVKRS